MIRLAGLEQSDAQLQIKVNREALRVWARARLSSRYLGSPCNEPETAWFWEEGLGLFHVHLARNFDTLVCAAAICLFCYLDRFAFVFPHTFLMACFVFPTSLQRREDMSQRTCSCDQRPQNTARAKYQPVCQCNVEPHLQEQRWRASLHPVSPRTARQTAMACSEWLQPRSGRLAGIFAGR